MSREQFKARDRITQKMTRDGLVERNETTGGNNRVSKREAEIGLRERGETDNTDSRLGNKPEEKTVKRSRYQNTYRQFHQEPETPLIRHEQPNPDTPPLQIHETTAAATQANATVAAAFAAQDEEYNYAAPDIGQDQREILPQQPRSEASGAINDPQQKQNRSGYRQNKRRHEPETRAARPEHQNPDAPPSRIQETTVAATQTGATDAAVFAAPDKTPNHSEPDIGQGPPTPSGIPGDTRKPGKGKFKTRRETSYRHNKASALQRNKTETLRSRQPQETSAYDPAPADAAPARIAAAYGGAAHISDDRTANAADGKRKIRKESAYRHYIPDAPPDEQAKANSQANAQLEPDSGYNEKPRRATADDMPGEDKTSADTDTPRLPYETSEHDAGAPTPAPKDEKGGKLRFSADETAPEKPENRKLTKAGRQFEKTSAKLEKARDNLPVTKKLRIENVVNEETGKTSRKLYFEKTVKTRKEHLKGALPLRPVKAGANALIIHGHRKLYEAEHENAGLKAAHRMEMVVEGGVRTALRHHKTAPYRKVAALEHKAMKKQINLTYRQMTDKNPQLHSNLFSRMWQKRKLKKEYAKKAREAQKTVKRAKKAAEKTRDGVVETVKFVGRHPVISLILLLLALLLIATLSMCSAGGSLGLGSLGGVVSSTYLAEDADLLGAEAAYAGMEADLQYRLDHYAALNPGFDEYRFDLDEIWHDPYVLTAIINALHEKAWTLGEVQDTLAMLFERQYILTETVTVEVRYRTERRTGSYTDSSGNRHSYSYTVQVPYNYYIRNVKLENFDLSHLPVYIMGEESLSRYALFMMTLGNRPDLFPVSAYPNASTYKEYGKYDIPPEYFADETFAAIIGEAEKYLGMPYVWGGYSPATSFDCSGFVSYVLNQAGWNIGRLGAQGLYNISTPVSASEAKPGDLIFFVGTYDTPGVSHVGIYVGGGGVMLHCGDPIGYASINTAYWQSHFFAYGKVYD